MTVGLVYAVGTLAAWAGWSLAFRTVWLIVRPPVASRLAWLPCAGLAAAALALGSALAPPDKAPLQLPLFWPVMPFVAWLAAFSLAVVLVRLVQIPFALNPQERKARFGAAGVWGGVALLAAVLYYLDPNNKIEIFTGGVPLHIGSLAALILAVTALTVLWAAASRQPKTRKIGMRFVAHTMLISGSVAFGLPFVFLVVTSFKEDRDMASAEGIVWVPKVQQTTPYRDSKNPVYEAIHNGQEVQALRLETLPNGRLRLDIVRPLAIRGTTFEAALADLRTVPRQVPLVDATMEGAKVRGMVVEELQDGRRRVQVLEPASHKGREAVFEPAQLEPVRKPGLRWQNYTEALSFMPPETNYGLAYLRNTLLIVVLSVIGTLLSSSIAAYAFARMRFPGRDAMFAIMLGTMMLPGAVLLLPQFLIFRSLGWIDTLLPIWAPAFVGSAFNIFLLRQFFRTVPMELEDAAKIDGCSYPRAFWSVMLPQIKPALAVISIWTFMGAWNNFMGPLVYVNSPEKMPLSYALALFMGDRSAEPGLMLAFATLTVIPVLILFFAAQKYFIEGVALSGFGGR